MSLISLCESGQLSFAAAECGGRENRGHGVFPHGPSGVGVGWRKWWEATDGDEGEKAGVDLLIWM